MEQYTKALHSRQAPSIAFAAVLHSNRAAARQLLGQHAEAIADCLRATALNPEYAKASCQCLMQYHLGSRKEGRSVWLVLICQSNGSCINW